MNFILICTRVLLIKSIAIIAVCLLISGCHYTTQHDDAELVHTRGMYRSVAMYLPPVQIGEVGAVTFHIRELPVPMYPQDIEIPDLTKHGGHYGRKRKHITDMSNWGDCIINIQIATISGDVIYANTTKLRDLTMGGTSAPGYEKLNVSEYTTLSLRLYELDIEPAYEDQWTNLQAWQWASTITPSIRKDDWLRVMGLASYDSRIDNYRQHWLTPFKLGGSSRLRLVH